MNKRISKKGIAEAGVILCLIPLTIFAGVYLLEDRSYYFISLMVIIEAMLTFAAAFEGRKPQAREIVMISVLCALAVAGRTAFASLPHFKPVTAMVIISGASLGGEVGFFVGAVSGFVSNFFFGQGPWTPWQMFSFGIIGFISGAVFARGRSRPKKIPLCIFGFFSTLIIYGGLMNTATVLLSQQKPTAESIISACALGFPLDMVHAVSTVVFLWLAAEPICEKIDRVKIKYGMIDK